jgi:hypothetical protein
VACEALKDGNPPEGAMAKLAMAESFLIACLEVVQKVSGGLANGRSAAIERRRLPQLWLTL